MIPRIIHYCWLSGDSYPEKIQSCIDSWKKHLAGYEIWLWDSDRFDICSVPWVKEAVEAKRYAFAADYIRFYALYHYGGIYLDSDVEVLKGYDDLMDRKFFFGFEYSGQPEAAVIGAEKHLEWIRKCMEWYEGREYARFIGLKKQIVAPTIFKYGFEEVSRVRLIDGGKAQNICGGTVFPYQFFSPKNGFTGELCISQETYSIHHFNAGWLNENSASIRLRRRVHVFLIKCMGKERYNRGIYYIRKILHKA